ncbi:MAG: hypothetical protein KAV41_03140 [Candidatus Pacebacteria bacterium]|nr:hypothetical protein [Candidatus Paceibacterota bacterium]
MQSIKEKLNKIKAAGERLIDNQAIFTILIIVLVAFSSFGLGRLSKIEENKTPLAIYDNATPNYNLASITQATEGGESVEVQPRLPDRQAPQVGLINGGKYVASKNSDKYHAPWCSGAKRIKEENKIWFNSKEEAEKAGYKPAGNCKGI